MTLWMAAIQINHVTTVCCCPPNIKISKKPLSRSVYAKIEMKYDDLLKTKTATNVQSCTDDVAEDHPMAFLQ